jgi:hypothetical protein
MQRVLVRTYENHKTLLVRKDEQKHTDETRGGHNEENIIITSYNY